MSTFYTSDHHFGHNSISRLVGRPWVNTDEMDEALIEAWNSVVGPNDTVYHLGDWSLSLSKLAVAQRLNGRIILVAGNHDLCWSGRANRAKADRAIGRYEGAFDEVHPSGMLVHSMGGMTVLLSHLPYYGDSGHDERYRDLRPRNEGLPIVCGHVHNAWVRQHGGDGRVHRGQVNVGVDVWDFTPVHEDRVIEEVRNARQEVL